MKKIIRLISITFCLTVFTHNINAQVVGAGNSHSNSIKESKSSAANNTGSIGFDLAIPFEDGFGLSYGFSLLRQYGASENAGVTLHFGYTYLANDFDDVFTFMVPLQLGYRYFMESKGSGLYAHGQAGIHWTAAIAEDASASSTNFSFALGGGYMVNPQFDIGARINFILGEGSFPYLGLRAAYAWPIKK
jgi:hypothetical protein